MLRLFLAEPVASSGRPNVERPFGMREVRYLCAFVLNKGMITAFAMGYLT